MTNSILDEIDFTSESIAIKCDDQKISYRQLEQKIMEVRRFLKKINSNSVVTVLDNCIEWVVIDFACQSAGIPYIPLPHFFTESQINSVLSNTNASTLFLSKNENKYNENDSLYQVEETNGLLKHVVCLQNDMNTLVEMPRNTSKITFTSGSTGIPKGVCLSTRNQIVVAKSLVERVAIEQARHLCILPLSTLLENIAGIYAPLLTGGTVILVSAEKRGLLGSSNLDVKQMLSCISVNQPNSLILVPELLFVLVNAAENGWSVPTSLKFIAVGGSKVSKELLVRAAKVRLPVYQGYGLSECSSVIALSSLNNNKLGTVGKLLPHVELRIKNNEFIISGNIFLGYLGDEESWYKSEFNSGDLGEIDEDGYCTVNGRKKNLIISSYGRNISPEWIENHFLQQESSSQELFQQCFVFGDAKPFCTALLCLFDTSTPRNEIEYAIEKVNQKLPDYAQIKNWLLLPFPLSYNKGFMTENNRPRRSFIAQYFKRQIDSISENTY